MCKERLNNILLSNKPSNEILNLIETGEIEKMIPEVMKMKGFKQHTPYHDKDVLNHTLAVIDSIKPQLNLRMAAFLHDIAKPYCLTIDEKGIGHFHGHHIKSAQMSEDILKRLGYDDEFIKDVKNLIRYHYYKDLNLNEEGVKILVDNIGKEHLNDLFELIKADTMGKAKSDNFYQVDKLKELCKDYLNR